MPLIILLKNKCKKYQFAYIKKEEGYAQFSHIRY